MTKVVRPIDGLVGRQKPLDLRQPKKTEDRPGTGVSGRDRTDNPDSSLTRKKAPAKNIWAPRPDPLTRPAPKPRPPIAAPAPPRRKRVPRARWHFSAAPRSRAGWITFGAKLFLAGMLAAALAYDNTLGQWALVIYAGVVLIRHIDSRQPFGLALILLVSIPILQAFHISWLAENMAIYAYILLVIGVAAAIRETLFSHKTEN